MSSLLHQLKQMQPVQHQPRTKLRTHHDTASVTAVILGGGQGTRLFPLTHAHCKPAILFGGRYRLIDVPISNALNSGINKIFVLTQFLARSLHNHIFHTYRHDFFSPGFVEVLAAEQRPGMSDWYKGTADAVRQNIQYLKETESKYFLILSGDQLYRMNYKTMLSWAEERDSDVVIATLPVNEKDAPRMGIMKVNEDQQIIDFYEKPSTEKQLHRMKSSEVALKSLGCKNINDRFYLGSMGIYLFKREVLLSILEDDIRDDFGKHLIPTIVQNGKASAFIHDDYWEDIGTIESFYNANMALNAEKPPLSLYDDDYPIFSTRCYLPGARISNCQVKNSMICEGSIIMADEVSGSILGQGTNIGLGSIIQDSYIMGSEELNKAFSTKHPPHSIGEECLIKRAIIDKNVLVGNRVQLVNKQNLQTYDSPTVYIRDGIIVVPRGATIPDDFVL